MMAADRYNEIKLDIFQSLARSQKALAVILESVADVCADRREVSEQMLGHLDVLAHYQIALAEKLGGVRLAPRTFSGLPAAPWINERPAVGTVYADGRRQ